MSLQFNSDASSNRVCECACGALRLEVTGEPARVYTCSCLDCQKLSGSAFTYRAFFPASAITVKGKYSTWRRPGKSGNMMEHAFCPTCGSTLLTSTEALKDMFAISVGSFADPSFHEPKNIFWTSRRHAWLPLPVKAKVHQEQ